MLSMTVFLLFPLVALGTRLRHDRRTLLLVMLIAAAIVDTDARWNWLTPSGGAGIHAPGVWAAAVVTTMAYVGFPKKVIPRIAQFAATMAVAWFASLLGGFWIA